LRISYSRILICLLFAASFIPSVSHAQFWQVMPPVSEDKSVHAGFSNDEKQIFYISDVKGVPNIFRMTIADKYGRIIAGPGNPPVQVTKFTDRGVVRMIHLLNLPEIIYMRATENGKDYHIYRMKDDGTNEPQDLTPAATGVTTEIIGASYNGRFVYYTENKVNHDKVDTYRYDTQQYTTDMVFPNDKDYRVLAWSRDHGKLLVEDPHAGDLMMFDIVSTERTTLVKPTNGRYIHALMDPSNHNLIVIEKVNGQNIERAMEIGSNVWKDFAQGDIMWVDFSPNGKYTVVEDGNKWSVREVATGADVPLPPGAQPAAIAPKEILLLYTTPVGANTSKLFLYDIGKKASFELTTIATH
jgi:hypothetical protein